MRTWRWAMRIFGSRSTYLKWEAAKKQHIILRRPADSNLSLGLFGARQRKRMQTVLRRVQNFGPEWTRWAIAPITGRST